MKYKIILFFIVLTQISCYKEYDLIKQEYYFLRGLFVNGQAPNFQLYYQNTQGGYMVNYTDYQLEVINENNTVFKMNSSGNFTFLSIKPKSKYKVRWKLNSEKDWHELTKESINYETTLNDKSFVKAENELFVNRDRNDSFVYFLYNPYDRKTFEEQFLESFLIEYPDAFLELNQTDNALILWPPSNKYYLDRFKNSTNFCFKPFTWKMSNGAVYRDFQLYSMSKSDFQFYYNLHKNDVGKNTPLAVGEGILWDYSKDNVKAKIVNINNYNNIKIFDYVNRDERLYVDFLINNKPIDTLNYKIIRVFSRFENSDYTFPVMGWQDQTLYAGFKEYFAHHYNECFSMPCGFIKEVYPLRFFVHLHDLKLNRKITIGMPTYEFTNGDSVVLDIKL
jgi:hypothetical protein